MSEIAGRMLTASYAPEDNKLRLYSASRLDAEDYARVKAAGFAWAPKQDCFVAPMWTPAREDLALELAGEIDDEDTSLVNRAQQRADRFGAYSEHRQADYQQARNGIAAIADQIPLGQPILVGHHSERHARKDAERIRNGMARAVQMWEQAEYWQERAKGALRHAKYRERADVRARRIKGLEADLRKQQKTLAHNEEFLTAWQKYGHSEKNARDIANHDHLSQCFPLADYPRESFASQYEGVMSLWVALESSVITPLQAQDIAISAHERIITYTQRWIAHLTNRLAYEQTMLADAGGTVADRTWPEKGGACRCWVSRHREWLTIQKVNKISVTLLDNWGNGESNFTRTIPFDKLSAVMAVADVEAKRDAGLLRDNAHGTGFYLLGAPQPASADQP